MLKYKENYEFLYQVLILLNLVLKELKFNKSFISIILIVRFYNKNMIARILSLKLTCTK